MTEVKAADDTQGDTVSLLIRVILNEQFQTCGMPDDREQVNHPSLHMYLPSFSEDDIWHRSS